MAKISKKYKPRSRRVKRSKYSTTKRYSVKSGIVHRFTRTVLSILTVASSPAAAGMTFKLSDLPNYSEYTALYDQFRIDKVIVTFEPVYTDWSGSKSTADTQNFYLPSIYTCLDYDDANSPLAVDDILQYSTEKHGRFIGIHKRILTPSILVQNYETDVSTAYTPAFRRWVSSTDPTTRHFGLKYWIDTPGSTMVVTFRLFVKYFLSMKGFK